jgi:hypothetical protein
MNIYPQTDKENPMGRKLDMRWSFGMRYLIATLKDGDDDGWAEAQLIKLAEDLDDNNDRAAASPDRDLLDPIEVPRHGDVLQGHVELADVFDAMEAQQEKAEERLNDLRYEQDEVTR